MDSLPQRRRSKRLKGENPDGTPSYTAHFATQPKVIHPVDEPTRLATLQPSLAVGSSELQTGFTSPQASNRIVAQLLGAAKRPWPAPAVKRAEKRENVYAKLYISAFDVGRVAPSRIFCLLPHVEVPIVMVGDRDGHIGLWDVALAQDVVNPFQTEGTCSVTCLCLFAVILISEKYLNGESGRESMQIYLSLCFTHTDDPYLDCVCPLKTPSRYFQQVMMV